MPSNWDTIKKTVKDELSDAAATTKKYVKIGRAKLDLRDINNSLNDSFRELGTEVYNLITGEMSGDIRHNPKVKSLIDKVNRLKQSIKDEELEMEAIKKGSDPQTRTNGDADKPSDDKATKTD